MRAAADEDAEGVIAQARTMPTPDAVEFLLSKAAECRDRTPDAALKLCDEALAASKRAFGDSRHPKVAACIMSVANVKSAQGLHAEALLLYEEALAMRPGGEGWTSAQILANMASAYAHLGDHAKALALDLDALALYRRDAEVPPAVLAMALNNIGCTLDGRGQYSKAFPYYQEALEIWRRLAPPDQPAGRFAGTVVNAAINLKLRGKLDDALVLFNEGVALQKTAQGDPSAAVAATLHNVACTLADLGRAQEAARVGGEALRMSEDVLGAEHAQTVAMARRWRC